MKTGMLSSIDNVVVGVDFSKSSRMVLKQAEALAKKMKANLVIVYVAEDPVNMAAPTLYTSPFQYVPPTPKEMITEVKKFYRITESEKVSIVIRRGAAAKNILQVAKALPNPLIVVGSVGHGAFSRFILGSQAEELALNSPYPVWIHRGSKIKELSSLLVPVDFSSSTQGVVDVLKGAATDLKLKLNYLYIQSETYPFLDYETYLSFQKKMKIEFLKFKKQFEKINPSVKIKVKSGDAAEEIVMVGKNYDAIVMRPHNHPGLFKKFGKVTAKVIRLADVPILII